MGSNLKKIRSLNLNTKIILLGMLFPLGFLGTFLLNNFIKETYSSRKTKIEEIVERVLNKEVILGDYSGIRFLGFSVGNSKIIDLMDFVDFKIKSKYFHSCDGHWSNYGNEFAASSFLKIYSED